MYLVANTIVNVTTQDDQLAVFGTAAAHLEPGGCFVYAGAGFDSPTSDAKASQIVDGEGEDGDSVRAGPGRAESPRELRLALSAAPSVRSCTSSRAVGVYLAGRAGRGQRPCPR